MDSTNDTVANDNIWEYLVSRLQEPSTWVSLGSLSTAVGFMVAPDKWQAIAAFGMGLGGLLGMILRERKKTTATEIKNVVQAVVKPQSMETAANTLSKPELDQAMKNGGTK